MTSPKGRGKTCEPDVKAIELVERLNVRWEATDKPVSKKINIWALERKEAATAIANLLASNEYLEGRLEIFRKSDAETVKELDAAEKRAKELEVGIKRLSDEEELLAETTDGDMFSMVSLAAKLAASEHREKELAGMVRAADDSRVEQIHRATEAEASNKLLSERVAVLEGLINDEDALREMYYQVRSRAHTGLEGK